MTTIKITELTDIGANLATSTVIPVVNMAGTPTTEKTVLGNIANVVLAGAGGNYVAAAKATTANTVTINAQPNITSTGNLIGLTVSNANGVINFTTTANVTLGAVGNLHITGGTTDQLLTTDGAGNLSWTTVSGGGANTGNVTFNDINIIGTGNLNLQPNSATGESLDIYLTAADDIHIAGSGNIILGTDEQANVAVLTNGNVAIQAGNVSGTQTWTFDTTGDINIPPNATSTTSGRIQSANGYPTLLAYGTGSHGGPELTWANTDDVNDLGNANVLRNTMYINESGLWVGMNENLVANTFAGTWNFTPNGTIIFPTLEVDLHNGGVQPGQVLQFGNSSQQAIITGPTPSANVNAQRIIIQGQRGNGELSEGGDVYVWAGDADTNGGDIKIYAGDADNASAGSGGYINLAGGDGFDNGGDITLNGGLSANGYGGQISITGGQGQIDGGPASITGGYATAGNGGAVNITGGTSSVGPSAYGNVEIGSGIYGWSFNNEGNLVLPGNTFAVNYANGTQVSLGGGANTGNVTFSDQIVLGTGSNDGGGGLYLAPGNASIANSAVQYLRVRGGDYPTHIHLDTGNNEYYDQYFGADSRYVKLEANGNIVINADDYNGNSGTWTFDTTGNLTLPGDIVGTANANFTIYSNAAAHEFIFGDDGTFYAPDNVVLGGNSIYIGPGANALSGIEHEVFIASSNLFPYVQAVVNNVSDQGSADWVALGAKGGDAGGQTSLGFTSSGFADANYTITGHGDGYVLVQTYAPGQIITGPSGGNLVLATGNNGTTKDIIFGTGGFLSSNIFGRISHANNSLELSRTGATITFPDATEQNTAWTGSVTTIANGNSNVNIATSNGNIVITSAGTNEWNFDSTGNLTIPGSSGGFIKTVANASIGIVAVDNGTNNPAQLLSMTNAGAATSIISAYATNATIQTNATGTLNTWQFDNAGNLTLPTGGQIVVSGGLVSSGASPAPTINGFSITNSVGISGNGNIAGNNISATGNVTAQGVGTNLVRRANTISGSNTAVTLDNLNAYVGGTPIRLYIGAATSNMTMAGQSQTMSTGALAVSSWINVPIVTGVGNGFAMSGAITNDGDTAVLNVTDQGGGSGTWRVTGMIANTSANLYSVSIERLA